MHISEYTGTCSVCAHEAHTHTHAHTYTHTHTASTPARPWCVGDGDASRARVFPSQRHAHPRLVCGVDGRACM